jgi:CRP/FNR family cyclic AMP-dependent transcriptional regulator
MVDQTRLRDLPLFADLSAESLTVVAGHLRSRRVRAGTSLVMQEEPGEVSYIIVQGTIKVHVDQVDGTEVILALRGPGDVVGEMSVVDNLGRSASLTTLEQCDLLWIERAAFWGCLQAMPGLACNLVRILSVRLRQSDDHVQILAAHDLHQRVAHQILSLADVYGRNTNDGSIHIPLRLTQSDLAALVGASRVHVNRVCGTLKRHGAITVSERHQITVQNREVLERYFA